MILRLDPMRKIIKTLIKLWLKLPYLKLGETRSYGDIATPTPMRYRLKSETFAQRYS